MEDRTLSTSQLADELTISNKAILRWVKAGCPHDEKIIGKKINYFFNRIEVADWMEANNVSGKPGRPRSEDSEEKLKLEISILRTKDKIHKLDLAAREDKLISRKEQDEITTQRILFVKNGLLSLSATLSQSLVGLDAISIRETIDKEAFKLLELFSK